MASRVFSRSSSGRIAHRLISASSRKESFASGFHSLREPAAGSASCSLTKYVPCQSNQLLRQSIIRNAAFQRFGFSSSASPQPIEEANRSVDHNSDSQDTSQVGSITDADKSPGDSSSQKQENDTGLSTESKDSKSHSGKKRRESTKRAAFSDSDTEPELSTNELVKLVAEKEELLKLKHKEIEKMQDKVLRSYAEMENVIDRAKREAENSKKFAIQNFAKSLLDVADNLARASSVVKESFSKIDTSKDSAGAVPLLKTLLEGVEMTDKQLSEVFKKFGVERFDPMNEHFDPHRHLAVFQIPDASKPPGTVAAVLKSGYMLHDRVIRPAEVGVITEALNNEADQSSSE